jgi:hypothetical protein
MFFVMVLQSLSLISAVKCEYFELFDAKCLEFQGHTNFFSEHYY